MHPILFGFEDVSHSDLSNSNCITEDVLTLELGITISQYTETF